MKDKILTHVTAMILSGALLASFPVTGQDANNLSSAPRKLRYVVKDLGTLGGAASVAEGISDRGWVVGSANLVGDQNGHAYLWRDGVMTDLGTLGGPNSQEQWPVNDNRGLIVGTAETKEMEPFNEDFCGFDRNSGVPQTGLICLGFLWRDGVMRPLPTLGGNNSYAAGVNNRGQAVGWAENSTQDPTCLPPQVLDFEAVIWGPETGDTHELRPLSGDTEAFATGINDNGLVIGASGVCSNGSLPIHGVVWQDGTPTDLGNLGGVLNTLPSAINSRGQVVGNSDLTGDNNQPPPPQPPPFHTFLWTKDSGMQDLGTLPGDFYSGAFGINEQGQVVGGSCTRSFNLCRAFLWQNGVMTDVNALVMGPTSLHLWFGNDINSRGEIAAYAFDLSNSEFHAALAIPCDEQHTDIPACNESAAAVAQTTANITVTPATGGNAKVTLPENVREQLRRRLRLARFGSGPMRLQQPNWKYEGENSHVAHGLWARGK
jgi:probable HAF family extracellular repeat protein